MDRFVTSETTADFHIKQAQLAMLDDIMQVENSWPETARAAREKFIARIEKFPEGSFIAYSSNNEQPLATITTMPMHFNPNDVSHFSNWDQVTNHGFLPENIDMQKCNALYIVSGVIDKSYRGGQIFEKMVLNIVDVAKGLGLDYVLAGAVIPGFKHYCEKHGEIAASDYCFTRRREQLVDPLLNMYEKIDFHVPNHHHVLTEYFPDDASKNYAALVMHSIKS
jgi:hypothetical protein